MFAGPNGSGKSSLKSFLPEELLGIYLNPDDIEREIRLQTFWILPDMVSQPQRMKYCHFS